MDLDALAGKPLPDHPAHPDYNKPQSLDDLPDSDDVIRWDVLVAESMEFLISQGHRPADVRGYTLRQLFYYQFIAERRLLVMTPAFF